MFNRYGLRFLNNVFQVPDVTYTIAYVWSISHFKWLMQQYKQFAFSITQGTSVVHKYSWSQMEDKAKLTLFQIHKNNIVCCLQIVDIGT
jgi:hypothetical protein